MTSRSSDLAVPPEKQWLSCRKRRVRIRDVKNIRDFGEITHLSRNKPEGRFSQDEIKVHKDHKGVALFKVPGFQQLSLNVCVSMKAKKNKKKCVTTSGSPSESHKYVRLSGIHVSVFSSGVRKKTESSANSSSCISSQGLESSEGFFCHKEKKGDGKCTAENQNVIKREEKRQKPSKKKHAGKRGNTVPNLPVSGLFYRTWLTEVGKGRQDDQEDMMYMEDYDTCGMRMKTNVPMSPDCGRNTSHKDSLAAVSCKVTKRNPLSEERSRDPELPAPMYGSDQGGKIYNDKGAKMNVDQAVRMDGDKEIMEGDQGTRMDGGQGSRVDGDQGTRQDDDQGTRLDCDQGARMDGDQVTRMDGDRGTRMDSDYQWIWMKSDDQEVGVERNTDELLAELSYCEKL